MARHLKEASDLDPADRLLTARELHSLLCKAAPKSYRLPPHDGREIQRLWWEVTRLLARSQQRAEDAKNDEASNPVALAVQTLMNALPELISNYQMQAETQAKWNKRADYQTKLLLQENCGMPRDYSADDVAARELLAAAERFLKLGLPISSGTFDIRGYAHPPIRMEGWKASYAEPLFRILHRLFPTMSKATRYEFIASLSELVLGATLRKETVSAHLKKSGLP